MAVIATSHSLWVCRQGCPCTGALMIVTACQGTSGQGCADATFFDFCGPTCAVGVSSGCNPRGPKIEQPLASDIDRLLAKQAHTAFVTCNQDNRAFEKWLAKTEFKTTATPKRKSL